MGDAQVVQVSRLLDERGIAPFHVQLIAWSVLIAFIDGYDISAIALAAPYLVQAWHVSPKDLGPVLNASLVGILFGSIFFGWIGDPYVRKTALIASLLLFFALTSLAPLSTPLSPLT